MKTVLKVIANIVYVMYGAVWAILTYIGAMVEQLLGAGDYGVFSWFLNHATEMFDEIKTKMP